MNVFLFSATKDSQHSCLLYNSYSRGNSREYDFLYKEHNTQSLAKIYNKAIDFALEEKFDYLVLCHDDVIIESDLIPKLKENFKRYDLFGVAGTTQCKLEKPALWHIMGGGFEGGNLHGAVAHGTEDEKRMTSFGPYPHQVVMVDGVFMAMNRRVMDNIRFDESCPSKWHFYDLDFSLQCHKADCKVGVSDIMITHGSPGLREFTDEFNRGQEWFLNKWRERNENS